MKNVLKYELLALDPPQKTRCENPESLLHMLRGFSSLWTNPVVNEQEYEIKDGETTLRVGLVVLPMEEDGTSQDSGFGRAFIVSLSGLFSAIEAKREPLTGFLKDQQFQLLYVLKDEVSEQIACKLYPHLYQIENRLRGYLIKFMSTRIGPTWWEFTVSAEIREKANMRKKNERVFGKHLENSAYLIDFAELGEIIYEQSSGFVTKTDILKQINELPETADAIKSLKADIQTNYQKLFKESFADKDFKDKWKQFEVLRNKIAHGNLFTSDDLESGEQLAKEIIELIDSADRKTEELVITEKEREAIHESVTIDTDFSWQNEITSDEFMDQLRNQENYYNRRNRRNGFVGISMFLRYLTNLGYAYHSAKKLVQMLKAEEKVEIYTVRNPSGEHDTSAIRTLL